MILRVCAFLCVFTTAVFSERLNLESYASAFDSIPLAVVKFRAISGGELVDNLPSQVIAGDLAFSGRFDVLGTDSIDNTLFQTKNIGIYIGGEYSISGKTVTLSCALSDATTRELLIGKKYSGDISALRAMAHKFSNLVHETILGDRGIYETKLLYVEENGYNKDVAIMDYDGANGRRITRDGQVNIFPAFADSASFVWTSFMRGKPDLYKGQIYGPGRSAVSYGRFISTSPAVSPIDNTLVFASSRDGTLDIYTSDLAGGNLKQLTFGKSIDTAPCFSPNGYQIAFTSDRSGSPQIYVMDADGVNVRRLTYDGGYQDSPAWSPKGDKIAYSSLQGGKFDVWVIGADGNTPVRVTSSVSGNCEYPAWSPDGAFIAFARSQSGKSDIWSIKPDGTGLRRITSTGHAKMPDWSKF